MKWTPSGYGHDKVEFTLLDLFKMMIGKELKNGALVAKRASAAKVCEEQMQGKSIWVEGARACAAAIKAKKEKNNG